VIPPLRVHVKGGVVPQVRWEKGPPAPDLIAACQPATRHRRDRHPPGVEVPASQKVDVAQADRGVLVVQRLRDLTDMYSRFLSFFLGGGALPLALALDDEASVFRNGQRPVMVAVGRRWVLLDAATTSPFKEGEDAVSVVPLKAAQNWKRRWPVMQRR
jgi:hypothetical protein